MIQLILIMAAVIAAAVLLGGNDPETVAEEYCRLECQERKAYAGCCQRD